jgi:hypothetical protein
MGDVPGVCALPLTRAVVQYRHVHEMDLAGGRIEDIGMALVVDGRYAAAAEAIDLGSGRTKVLDLSTELVVLDWVYEPTHQHVEELMRRAVEVGDDAELRRYGFRLGVRVLERIGFGPLTRPVLLRIGFRDVCRDLDLHEETSIRIALGSGRIVRAHLDYDGCALVFRTTLHEADPRFERALYESFPEAGLRRAPGAGPEAGIEYQARFGLPTTFAEARGVVDAIRRGLGRLTARFEPERFAALAGVVETFGARETLSGIHLVQSTSGREATGFAPLYSSNTLH